ncbi:uncharacterized protein JCM6883_002810 [Sporobolomyces salmoneus]|uniref:uncharacterized protein n=1 Tax=Sporobolomyces salmoneus TaxID=183962 RepID=UPI00316BD944
MNPFPLTRSSRRPLSTAQEGRLIRHLDPALLTLSGNFESRHSANSQLPTLSSFLEQLVQLLSFVLAIPAAKPSGSLRSAYLLQLTGYLAPAIEGYPLGEESLDKLFSVLERFDRGWAAILEGREWDSTTGMAKEEQVEREHNGEGYEVQALRTTDLVRIKSLIQDLRLVLSSSLNLPELVPLSINPFEQSLGIDVRRRFGPEGGQSEIERTPELSMGEETEDGEDDTMSIDTVQDAQGDSNAPQEEEDDEDSDEEFEQVEIVSPSSHLPPVYPNSIDDNDTFTSPSTDPADSPAAFEIHFNGPPPPTLTDGEITINSGETPIVGQRRGFDPDEEYPLEDEEDEEDGESRGGEGDGDKKAMREKVKRVFEKTEAVLRQLDAQRGS